MRLTFFFCFFVFTGLGQIPESRTKQLDSIVTNVDRETLRNLDSLHNYLHNAGSSDEERVFLFYGLIAIHYKYDQSRKGDKHAKEYSAYYVAYKKKAVCRDFALVFDELCARSDIPCVIASGRVSVLPWESVADMFKRKIRRVNHAWNVVKYNGEWHPVDPTWSKIDSIVKYYKEDDSGRRKYAGKVKMSNREYYKKQPRDFYKKRNCVHPAYYCMDTVYRYKDRGKRYKKRRIYSKNYDFNRVLDSLSSAEDYKLSKEFQSEISEYADLGYLYPSLYRDFKFTEIKYSRFDKPTVEDCEKHLSELERKLNLVKKEFGHNYSGLFQTHKQEVIKLKKRIARRQKALSQR
ncbi:MAG: transglutaminase domain-containing protein [Crocinitomicaceae bacterium]